MTDRPRSGVADPPASEVTAGPPSGVTAGTRVVRGRLAAVSVRAALAAGAWVGFALGLVFGAFAGAGLVWVAGAIVDWQRDLAFTLGVARRLLPFGDQVGLLRELEARWWLVIPAVALVVAAVSATVGALLGGIFAAAYRASPRHALVIVELPELPELPEPAVAGPPTVAGPPAVPSAGDGDADDSGRGRPRGTGQSDLSPVLHSRAYGDDREE